MKVVEIFTSIEGEGRRAGLLSTFIRLFGCNLNCSYCDSRYACEGIDYDNMSIEEILSEVEKRKYKAITVTGGEPLIHAGIDELLKELVKANYWVNVETNGSIEPSFFHPRLFYTMDFKTFASGMSDRMNPEAFKLLTCTDVLKFVVGSEEDLDQALEIVEKYKCKASVYVSPVFGAIEPRRIVEYMQNHKLWGWKIQLQLHKYIWNPEERGV